MTIGLGHYLAVGAMLFTLGILGIFLNRKNIIVILMSIELILLAVNINLVAFSTFLGDIVGQVFAMLVLTVAAAEAAIGLAILVVYFRNRGSIAVALVRATWSAMFWRLTLGLWRKVSTIAPTMDTSRIMPAAWKK